MYKFLLKMVLVVLLIKIRCRIIYAIICLLLFVFKFSVDAQSWTPTEFSHFGVDGFETADFFRLTPLQLDSAYRWEANGLRSMNISWNRTLSPMGGQFRWDLIEPVKGMYDWSRPDLFVRRIQAENLHLLVLVHPFTTWDQPGKNNGNYDKPNDMQAFKRFIANMVERYDGDGFNDMPGLLYPIKYYEIGNEPEGSTFGNSPGTYNDFMQTVKAAYDTAKVVFPDVKIVIGGTSPIYDTQGFANQVDAFWKGALNRSNVSNYFDIFNFHFFVGQYTKDIKDYLDYWKNLLATYGLSDKEIWMTETGTYSGTSVGPDRQSWPYQSTEYQASWWVKHCVYGLTNGIKKFFWVFYYSNQSDWRTTVSFVNIDRTTKKSVYYTHKLLAEKLDAFTNALQNNYSASSQYQTSGNFTFTVNGKVTYVLWNDLGGNITLNGLPWSQAKITKSIPNLDENGNVILDASGNPVFDTSRVSITNGQLTLTLSSIPLYVEEGMSAPLPPQLLSPFNGATGISTSPVFSWNSSIGATSYHLQISTNSNFTSLVYDQSGITGTSRQVLGLANNTLYYWRVNASNNGGSSEWSTIWSFTTIIGIPEVPTLLSPPDGATGIEINPILRWNASTGASSYRLQVSIDSIFTMLVYDQNGITDVSQQVSGLVHNTLYYWRVNASNAGGTSPYSSTWRFTTILILPSAPTLVSPLNGATGVSTSPILYWNSSTGAVSYRLQVSTNADFTSLLYDQSNITVTSQQVFGLENNKLYYWRVNATNAVGSSEWSAVWNFTTIIGAPETPTLVSPSNGATGISIEPILSWNQSLRATTYRLQISISNTFLDTVFDDSTLTTTSYKVGPLANNTMYFWRVNAKNSGGTSAYSNIWSFQTVVAAPEIPILLSPSNGAIDIAVNPILSWNASVGANSYRLQISTNLDFTSLVYDQSGITTTSQQITGLAYNTLYYWRIRATNDGGFSDWSTIWNFMTTVPTLIEQFNSDIPVKYALYQNYPNPFNPITTIQFSIPKECFVKLVIFNSLGMQIETLVNQQLSAGYYRLIWNPKNIPSGVYFYKLESNGFTDTKKLLLLR